MAYLARLDCLFFEEVGMVDGSLFVTLEMVLRRVMRSDRPWGGKLIVCTGKTII